MAMKIQVAYIWVVSPCKDMVAYWRFGGPCCLYLPYTAPQLRSPRLEHVA